MRFAQVLGYLGNVSISRHSLLLVTKERASVTNIHYCQAE